VGGRFWLRMAAAIVAIGIGAAISFLLIGSALVKWGVFGALILVCVLALAISWIADRRRQTQYE
jgi:succinate-acetate transporter protein